LQGEIGLELGLASLAVASGVTDVTTSSPSAMCSRRQWRGHRPARHRFEPGPNRARHALVGRSFGFCPRGLARHSNKLAQGAGECCRFRCSLLLMKICCLALFGAILASMGPLPEGAVL